MGSVYKFELRAENLNTKVILEKLLHYTSVKALHVILCGLEWFCMIYLLNKALFLNSLLKGETNA